MHRSSSEEGHQSGSGDQRWKLIGHKEKKERGERATSPKANKKGKGKKVPPVSRGSPALLPASGDKDVLVLTNPASRQSKVLHTARALHGTLCLSIVLTSVWG